MDNFFPYQPDELLVKFLLGEASEEEVVKACQWIADSPENEKYFHQLRAVWESQVSFTPVAEPDESEAWLRFQKRIQSESNQPIISGNEKNRIRTFPQNQVFRIAASLILAVATIALGFFIYRKVSRPELLELASRATIQTLELPDGSTIILNKNSTLRYPEQFSGPNRDVSLQGEGFFTIQPNKNNPFQVRVKDLIIRVVGTSFNIREGRDKTEVIVETGIVQVILKNKIIKLHRGERIIVDEMDQSVEKEQQADLLYNYYRTKKFTCDKTPLWKLVEALNQAYEVKITISNPAIRSLPLTTTFEQEPLENILRIIAQTLDIQVEKADGKIILK